MYIAPHPVAKLKPFKIKARALLQSLMLALPLLPATLWADQPSLSSAPASYQAGMALVAQNRLQEAVATFRSAVAGNPGDPVLLDALGAACSLQGNFEEASKHFLESLAISPGFMPAQKNLAISYFNLQHYDQATAEFAKLKAMPGAPLPTIDMFLGMIAEKTGDYAQALVLSAQAGDLLYKFPEAMLAYANAAIHQKQFKRAQTILAALDALHPLSAAEYMRAGALHQTLGQNAQALAAFDKASALEPTLEGLQYNRASLLDQMQRPREAETVLRSLIDLHPDSESLNLLAHVAQENREFPLAVDSLRRAARLDPNREENYLDFASLCADYGNYSLSLEAADAGLAHIPGSYRLLVQKGVALENLGRIDEAENVLSIASGSQKDNSVALLTLAIVQSQNNQLHEAETTLTSALHNFPGNYYMHYQLGKVLTQLSEAEGDSPAIQARARQAFTQTARLNPSFADAYFQLAKLSLHQAPLSAERNLLTCLRLDPQNAPAEYMLARLYLSTGRRAAGQARIDQFEKLQQAAKLKEQQQPRISPAQN